MKPTGYLLLLFFSMIAVETQAQDHAGTDSTGLPGDNFSLQGALEMFKRAKSPEEFEKFINTPDNHVNNLDLNNDGKTDYVKVIDNGQKNAHAIVLQAVVSKTESQDIAVIELEKTGDTSAVLQIVGDEDMYGKQVIAEPGASDDKAALNFTATNAYVLHGPNAEDAETPPIIVNVWFWPVVHFIYLPTYVVWRSPWAWEYYPGWWSPWRPFRWYMWHPFHLAYERSFVIVPVHRVMVARRIYTPLRVTSVTVIQRNQPALNHYRTTRRMTTVSRPDGNRTQRTNTGFPNREGQQRTGAGFRNRQVQQQSRQRHGRRRNG